jgi:hypothetical protein
MIVVVNLTLDGRIAREYLLPGSFHELNLYIHSRQGSEVSGKTLLFSGPG